MILYASSPDGVAQQQNYYDQLRMNAEQNNAARFDAAQARALQATLQQRESDRRSQDAADTSAEQADQFNQRLAFEGQQGDLNRASHEKDVNTQYSSTHADRQDAINQRDFEQAQKLAMAGQIPQTEEKVASLYPNFSKDQIKVLAAASSQHAFDRFGTALDMSIRAGNPLPLEAVSKIVNPDSPMYKDAIDFRTEKLAPFVQQFKTGEDKARKGNLAAKIQADTEAAPLPTSLSANTPMWAGGYANPINWGIRLGEHLFPDITPDNTIQPRGDWQTRAPSIVSSLRAGNDPAVTTDVTTGKFVNTMLNPNGGPQAPEPIVPPIQPGPVAPVPGVPTVTTQAQFDALPSGAIYIGKNGKQFRKP